MQTLPYNSCQSWVHHCTHLESPPRSCDAQHHHSLSLSLIVIITSPRSAYYSALLLSSLLNYSYQPSSALHSLTLPSPLQESPSSLSHHCSCLSSPVMTKAAALAHKHYSKHRVVVEGNKTVTRQVCKHCPADSAKHYAEGTSTTVLEKHIANAHPDARVQSSSRGIQMSMEDAVTRIDNHSFQSALAKLYARCSLAHQIVELPEFTDLIDCARRSDCDVPKRKTLRRSQLELAQSLRARVVRQLRNYCHSSPLTIAIDGWTNVNTAKVTNVVILCGGEAYYWCSIVNSRDRNTAVWLTGPLVEVLNSIRGEGLMFAGLVADNEQVNKCLFDMVSASFPFLINSPCAAHLVQLCVLKALELLPIDPVLTAMESLLRSFRAKVRRLKLKAVQEAATDSSHTLVRPCDTRWSSQLYAGQRLLKLKTYVDLVIPQSARFWLDLEEVIRFLKPFQIATDVMQKDKSTLYDTYQQFKTLLQHVKSTEPTSLFHSSMDDIVNIIIDMWEKHVNIDAGVMCAQLSFDPAVDTIF